MKLLNLLRIMADKKASDLYVAPGAAIQMKINGTSVPVSQARLNPQEVEELFREVLTEAHWEKFLESQELNVGHGVRDIGSFRFSLFRQRGSAAGVVRYIPSDIPDFSTLNLPTVLTDLIMQKNGLILVVGSTGSGKTTTLCSLIDYRNTRATGHILTLEDPIEFTFRNKMSIVNQRQIGTDCENLSTALKNALRQAPDCILIGEIRDVESMGAAIAYAQSGHLVLATLHANNAPHALNRILSFYTPDNRPVLLGDLSTTLRAVVSLRLLKSQQGGRIPATEVLLNTHHVAELIQFGRISELREALDKSMSAGSHSFEQSLIELVVSGRVTKQDALAYSDSPNNLLWMLDNHATRPVGPPAITRPNPTVPDGSVRPVAARLEPGAVAPPDAVQRPAGPASFDSFQLNTESE